MRLKLFKGWVELLSLLDSKVKKLTEPYCIQYTLSCCDKIWEDALKTCLLFCISRKLGQSISWEGGIISSLFFYYVIFLPFIITFSHKNILNINIYFKTAIMISVCSNYWPPNLALSLCLNHLVLSTFWQCRSAIPQRSAKPIASIYHTVPLEKPLA
jgi:hypothetical protein